MAQFILKINLGNDAMQTLPDIARILKNTCTVLSGIDSVQDAKEYGKYKMHDVNGNSVGFWMVE